MDQLVGGLIFWDCGFHPEVVRPLQDLVRTRLDLQSFQITRCNSDPTMAILTCFQNNHSQVRTLTMGDSLGIEDRLGGDAIRSVLRYNTTLLTLNLSGSHRLGQVGLRHLARGLGKNGTLRELNLSQCSVSHASLALLIQHVTGNPDTKLSSVNLSYNALNEVGIRLLVDNWLLHPECKLQELILNHCEVVGEAFLTVIRSIAIHRTPLEVLSLLECGRLSLHGLQELAESLFRFGNLRVFEASCFKSSVHPFHPAHRHAFPPGINDAADDDANLHDDDDNSDDEDESDSDGDPTVVEETANPIINSSRALEIGNGQGDQLMTGPLRLLRETFLGGLIHNKRLEHISLVNLLECVMKSKDAARVGAWMDFCGKRNQM
jgi:Leucine Rich repeat